MIFGDLSNFYTGTFQAGDDTIFGGAGDDTIHGDYSFINGTPNITLGNDSIHGGTGNDAIYGNGGNDALNGGTGNDVLDGGSDDDLLIGGAGFDVLLGSTGNDTLTGAFNADTFVFADFGGGFGNDVITDFAATNDFEKIDLSRVAAIVDFTDLSSNHMTQVGADVLIDAGGGNTITLLGVRIDDLDAVDVIF